jgi:hypothetical protein
MWIPIGGNADAKMKVLKPSGGHDSDMDGPAEMVYGVEFYHRLEAPVPKMPIKWSNPFRCGADSTGIAIGIHMLLFYGMVNEHLDAKLLDI